MQLMQVMVNFAVNHHILAPGLAIMVPLLTPISAQRGPGIGFHTGSGGACVFWAAAAVGHVKTPMETSLLGCCTPRRGSACRCRDCHGPSRSRSLSRWKHAGFNMPN